MVISMGLAVLFMSEKRELDLQLKDGNARMKSSETAQIQLQNELWGLTDLVMASPSKDMDHATEQQIKDRYEADRKKWGDRLNAIDNTVVVSTYTQMLDSVATVLDKKNQELNAAKIAVDKTNEEKAALDAYYKGQVMQFENSAKAATDEKAMIQAKLTKSEEDLRAAQEMIVKVTEDANKKVEEIRVAMQKQIDDVNAKLTTVQSTLDQKNEYIGTINKPDYASTYDGKIIRINPSARTVWINVGAFDNLKKHISFSVQPDGVPAGSNLPPKAKIEVVKILDDRMAECRIVEDDLNNPISVGDNIYTNLWDPGQKTRFGFAGKIDLNDDGTDDMDEVHSMVARSGGQIDVEVVNGVEKGELSIYTRYLVLGSIPADKPSAEAYNRLLDAATKLGVQRIPLPVFMDQIGYPKSDRRRVVFGGGSQTGTVAMDPPDGGQRVSPGSVSPAFTPRRAPAVNSAY
jgi:hypothetical protein